MKQNKHLKLVFYLLVVFFVWAILLIFWDLWQISEINKTSDTSYSTSDLAKKQLSLYYVAIGDNGSTGTRVGCGDSLVEVTTNKVTTNSFIKASFNRLLNNQEQYYGESGLYNVLYRSDLEYVSSGVKNGIVSVYLSGTLNLGGECDNPRAQAVLEMTAKTAANVDDAKIFLNSRPLSEVLSLQ